MAFLESSALIGLRWRLLHKHFQSGVSLLINPVLPHALTLGRREGLLGSWPSSRGVESLWGGEGVQRLSP